VIGATVPLAVSPIVSSEDEYDDSSNNDGDELDTAQCEMQDCIEVAM